MIKNLNIEGWNQFNKIDIDFHPRVTILTGANGSGKSTLIKLLSREMGWNYAATATPLDSSKIKSRFISGITLEKLFDAIRKKPLKDYEKEEYYYTDDSIQIGEITLENNVCRLYVPQETNEASYNVYAEFVNDNSYSINGVSIPSHREPYTYTNLNYIPVKPQTKNEALNEYLESLKSRYLPDAYVIDNQRSPIYRMKASLMSLAVFGAGNMYVSKNLESYKLFRGFVNILKKLLPENIQFRDIHISDGEIILVTRSGNFLLDAVSGGIGSIIDLAWQIYMYDNENEPFTVLIDEIENHLHPSMQRQILPNLIKAFPGTQFIVTTHSPFVVNSVADSSVYALKYNDYNLIDSFKLDFESKAANALEILRDILGVPVTLPIWIEEQLNNITEKYRSLELTPEVYIQLKRDLNEYGLDEHLPQALVGFRAGVKE